MDKIGKTLKALYHEIGKKHSLNGVEKQILWALVQPEINIPGGTTLGTHKALKNFKKRSSIRRAYEEFYRAKMGQVPLRSSNKS